MRRGLAALAFLSAAVVASAGFAAECEDGAQVEVTGTITRVWANKGGGTSVDVRASQPCQVDFIEISLPKPPPRCRAGASFTAVGEAEAFIGVMLHATELTCK